MDMKDLDTMLARLRDAPAPPGLAALDRTVVENLTRLQESPPPGAGMFGMAVAVALMAGIAGAALPAGPAPMRTPLDAPLALAPSTLLSLQ
jgi:hypothetical protein